MVDDNQIIVNKETGEIRGAYRPKLKFTHMEFAWFYAKNLTILGKIKPTKKEIILGHIISSMQNDNIVYLMKNFKSPLSKKLGCNLSYVSKVINEFEGKGLIHKIGRGVYIVNPWIYGKGSRENVAKIRWQFEGLFDKDGNVTLTHSVEIEKEDELER